MKRRGGKKGCHAALTPLLVVFAFAALVFVTLTFHESLPAQEEAGQSSVPGSVGRAASHKPASLINARSLRGGGILPLFPPFGGNFSGRGVRHLEDPLLGLGVLERDVLERGSEGWGE